MASKKDSWIINEHGKIIARDRTYYDNDGHVQKTVHQKVRAVGSGLATIVGRTTGETHYKGGKGTYKKR